MRDRYAMQRRLEHRVYLEGYGRKGEGEERGEKQKRSGGERERDSCHPGTGRESTDWRRQKMEDGGE